jgi:hypothetical protein
MKLCRECEHHLAGGVGRTSATCGFRRVQNPVDGGTWFPFCRDERHGERTFEGNCGALAANWKAKVRTDVVHERDT